MITAIFTQWKELWQIRNHDRHKKDYKAQADVAHRQAVTELMKLYELQDFVEPHLQWLFATPLYQLQNKRTSYLRAVIANFGPIIQKSSKAYMLARHQTQLETG